MSKFRYDERFDVLYIRITDGKNSHGNEDDFGTVTHKDRESGAVTAVTIFDFAEKLADNVLPTLPELTNFDYSKVIQSNT